MDLTEVGDVFDALDARSQDYAHFIPLFGSQRSFGMVDLCDELEDRLEPGGERVVLIDRAEVAPRWRGLGGVGRLLIARTLRWVCSDPRVVAIQPFAIDLSMEARQDSVVFEPAMERARGVWTSLGFEQLNDNIWIMDPRVRSHGDAVAAITQRIGLA